MAEYLSASEVMKRLNLSRSGVAWLAKQRKWQRRYVRIGNSISVEYLASEIEKEIKNRRINTKLP